VKKKSHEKLDDSEEKIKIRVKIMMHRQTPPPLVVAVVVFYHHSRRPSIYQHGAAIAGNNSCVGDLQICPSYTTGECNGIIGLSFSLWLWCSM
jgi:hypothetical protein